MKYYDKKGNSIDVDTWSKLFGDRKYRRIKKTVLPDGTWVSTVWLGLDHSFDEEGGPLIFETMVFPEEGSFLEEECHRYETEKEALDNHKKIVKRLGHWKKEK